MKHRCPNPIYLLSILFLSGRIFAQSPGTGSISAAQQFTINCSACHQVNEMIVGPSLVEMSKIYKDDIDGFVKWCISPGQKRKNAAQMPSMAHVGEKNLRAIHGYILKTAKGKKEKKKVTRDPHEKSYVGRKTPYVQRLFLKDSGPASIAVFVNDELAVCWDATPCRLRYVWKSKGFNAFWHWKGNGNGRAFMGGDTIYSEQQGLRIKGISDDSHPEYHGYKLINGFPEFIYKIGNVTVREYIYSESLSEGVSRKFTIEGATHGATLTLGNQDHIRISATNATITDNTLTLPGEKTISFTLTLSSKAK